MFDNLHTIVKAVVMGTMAVILPLAAISVVVGLRRTRRMLKQADELLQQGRRSQALAIYRKYLTVCWNLGPDGQMSALSYTPRQLAASVGSSLPVVEKVRQICEAEGIPFDADPITVAGRIERVVRGRRELPGCGGVDLP